MAIVQGAIPMFVAGDFNCINVPEEKRGGRPYLDSFTSREFKEFIASNGLHNLGLNRDHFHMVQYLGWQCKGVGMDGLGSLDFCDGQLDSTISGLLDASPFPNNL